MKGLYRIIAPYPEGAITQLARQLAQQNRLEKLFLSGKALAPLVDTADRLHLVPGRIAARLNRGLIPLPQAQYLNPSWEGVRMLASGLSPGRGLPKATFALKRAFDRAASNQVGKFDIQISLPASLRMGAQRNPESLNVFHAVDAHPIVHNEVLRHAYGRSARFEMVGPREVELICEELELADVVLVPSRVVAEGMITHGVDPAKIVRIPYGVDLGAFAPPTSRSSNAGIELVYVGQVSYRKGIPDLFKAIAGTGVSLSVIGPLVNRQLLRNMPDEVNYLGRIPHGEIAHVMGRADAFIMASLEDAFGLVITEALATGLPIITTESVGAIESISPEDLTTVRAGDAMQLRDAIMSVQPLDAIDRTTRAARLRHPGSQMLSWAGYAEAVTRALDTRCAMKFAS